MSNQAGKSCSTVYSRSPWVLMVCQNVTTNGLAENAPPEIKRNILKSIIDKIILNVDEGRFELEGVIEGDTSYFKIQQHAESPGENEPINNFFAPLVPISYFLNYDIGTIREIL